MVIDDLELQDYKNKLIRRIKINNAKIKDLEERKDKLLVHGYWDLGYYRGFNNELENELDKINTLLENN